MEFKFCPGSNEDLEKYEDGGFHPVKLMDKFKHGRYVVVHKLGFGGFSTVWLARDTQQNRYVALKLTTARSAMELREVAVQRYLFRYPSTNIEVSRILDRFAFTGPNGRHICLVFDVYGPSLDILSNQLYKLRPDIARALSRQIATSLAQMHEQDVAFGDLSIYNILLGLEEVTDWTLEQIYEALGRPIAEEVISNELDSPASILEHAPKDTYSPIQWHSTSLNLLKPRAVLTDLNEAVYVGESAELKDEAGRDGGVNHDYMAPEYAFGIDSQHSKASDVWALGCVFYELRASKSLFGNSSKSIHTAMQELLGELPAEWKERILSLPSLQGAFILPEDGIQYQTIEEKVDEVGGWLPWVSMSAKDRKQLIIDTQGEDVLQQEDDPMVKDVNRKSSPPPAKLSDEESADLKDLLSRMLTWRPEDRMTMEEVLQHPWLNKTYHDCDTEDSWIAQFHWGWDPKPPAVINSADFDMDDIDVDALGLDDDGQYDSEDELDEGDDTDMAEEDESQVSEGDADGTKNLCHAEAQSADLGPMFRPDHQVQHQNVVHTVMHHGRKLVRLIYGAWQTVAKLGMAVISAVCPIKTLETIQRNRPNETAPADTEDTKPGAGIDEAAHEEVMSEGDDDFFVTKLLGLPVAVEEVGSG